MATKLKEVDVVVVGLGWTGGILSKELTEAGKYYKENGTLDGYKPK